MTATINVHRYQVWVSWDMSEPAYDTDDMMDALAEFANILKTSDGMHVEVRADGKVIAAAPVEEEA